MIVQALLNTFNSYVEAETLYATTQKVYDIEMLWSTWVSK